MDGNGRWAKRHGLIRAKGHRQGAEAVRATVKAARDMGIDYVTLYAFSSENWKRPKPEVDALMRLLEEFLVERVPEMMEDGVRLRAIGDLKRLPERCLGLLNEGIQRTSGNTAITMTLALSYGGRAEIVDAARRIAADVTAGRLSAADIDESALSARLYTADMPDPDLLIRTSGEFRVSNFLLWQISYAEIHVTPKFWPDFGPGDLRLAVEDYQNRQRRFGAAPSA
jgi:undecaprenyl diphosphate synthase